MSSASMDQYELLEYDSQEDEIPQVDDDKEESERTEKIRCCCCYLPKWFKEEVINLIKIGTPLQISMLMAFTLIPVSAAMIGHIGAAEMDGTTGAASIVNALGLMPSAAIAEACAAVFSQAFGYGNKKLVGLYLQRGLFIATLSFCILAFVQLGVSHLLKLIGVDAEVCHFIGRFIIIFLPGLFANCWNNVIIEYLSSQNVVKFLFFITALACGVNVLYHYIFIWQLHLGVEGAALSQALVHITMLNGLFIYILVSRVYKETWDGFRSEAFQDLKSIIYIAIPGICDILICFIAMEIGIIASGRVGKIEMATMAIGVQFAAFIYVIVSFRIVVVFVGQKIGRGDIIGIKHTIYTSLILSYILSAVLLAILIGCRDYLPMIFTFDHDVIEMCHYTLLPVIIMYGISQPMSCFSSTLKGLGEQKKLMLHAVIFITPTLIISLLAFTYSNNFKVLAFLICNVCGAIIFNLSFFARIFFFTDWDEIKKKCIDRSSIKIFDDLETETTKSANISKITIASTLFIFTFFILAVSYSVYVYFYLKP